jgi:hypothetical protein
MIMSLISRYFINYNMYNETNKNTISKYINQILQIYHMVNETYNGYMTDKKDTVILSGYAAVLYYIYLCMTNYSEATINNLIQSPINIELIMVYHTDNKPDIDEFYIGDFKQITQETEYSIFRNEWTLNEIKEFKLISKPFSETKWDNINGVNIISLNELSIHYNI